MVVMVVMVAGNDPDGVKMKEEKSLLKVQTFLTLIEFSISKVYLFFFSLPTSNRASEGTLCKNPKPSFKRAAQSRN
jgi:hypothetical protein